jgi:hypothetical protein
VAKGNSAAAVHAVLEYAITKAVLQGKTGDTIVTLPVKDLVAPEEGVDLPDAEGLALQVTITTEWTSDEEALEIVDDEEGDINGNEEPTNSSPQGH